ncbi:MAG: glycoside hydrolase family 2 TIM barrel-domain containing protein [Deinococcales bacterium]
MAKTPRSEYPRPQFRRPTWTSLNGLWSFAVDPPAGADPDERRASTGFDLPILVPFPLESALSGVHRTEFMPSVWYHRGVTVPEAWAGQRVLLHFGGVDYECRAYLDGVPVGHHLGGSSSFTFDITGAVRFGHLQHLVVHALDDVRSRRQPAGKQSGAPESYHVFYTRVTGIWQSVWLEPVPVRSLDDVRIAADAATGRLLLEPRFRDAASTDRWAARLSLAGRETARFEGPAHAGAFAALEPATTRLWTPDDPHLYDVELELRDRHGDVLDSVTSYAGLRSVTVAEGRVWLNGEPLYQRLVLDQGYYPDGVWTAPSDAALRTDIEHAKRLGFNGARLHQKGFEERYHYWADRLGFLTWAESPSWGFDESDPEAARRFLDEWRELVLRDRNHPSIVAWTPLNESDPAVHPEAHARLTRDATALTHSLDATRPVNDASGWVHVCPDLCTVHCYEQDPGVFRALLDRRAPDVYRNIPELEPEYAGQPYLVDEFGGIKWIPDEGRERPADWGYGDAPADEAAFFARLEGLVEALLDLPHVSGYCYTQLTDVEQERNGLLNADRSPKFPPDRLRAIFERAPAWADPAEPAPAEGAG